MDVQKNDRTRWQVLALGRIDFSVEEPGPCSGIACVQSEQHPQQPQQDGNAHQRMGRARLSIYLPDLRTFPVRDGECAGDYMDRVWQSISEQQAQGIFTSYHTAVLCATCATTTLATLLAHGGKANLEEFLDSEVGRQAYGIATIAAVLAESTPDGVSQTVVLTAEPGADGRYCAEMVSTSRRTLVEQIVAAHAAANVRVYRVAYIAPNTHAQLESFYAVPQIATVLVPINYRLIADDFAYIINHSGARVVCVHADYLDAVEGIRAELPQVEHFVALEGAKDGWLQHEELLAAANGEFTRPRIAESDLLTINYTGGTTSRPKGVMITHRWEEGSFYLSSGPQSRHVQDLARDPRAGLCITIEESQTETGYRPFRQIMVRGKADVLPDTNASWARKLISKYIAGEAGRLRAELEAE